MKNLILILFIIPFFGYGQIIISEKYEKVKQMRFKESSYHKANQKLISIDTLNITELKDEFISVSIGKNNHFLSTSNIKNIKLFASDKLKEDWNVYDDNLLIPLYDEIDVLNFFEKYGFEYFKTSIKESNKSSALTTYNEYTNTAITTQNSPKNEVILIFKNNNN
jgi:hypothetical protein